MKTIKRFPVVLVLSLVLLLSAVSPALSAKAADLDRIVNYLISVSLNSDASLTISYHIDWKVLDSDSEGPLEWVHIGVPNSKFEILSNSSNIKKIAKYKSSEVRIDFDKKYYKNDVVSFEFSIHQEYMYNITSEGAVFEFTPGWFPDAKTDHLEIRWNSANALSKSPACIEEDGYFVWTKDNMSKGQKMTVSVTYDPEANNIYTFDETKTADMVKQNDYSSSSDDDDSPFAAFMGFVVFIAIIYGVVKMLRSAGQYTSTANLGTSKKITRTKIEYYPTCPGCGAPRPEGKDNCEYCGRSFIKSEEKIEEKDIPKEETELKSKSTNGVYRYHSSPNTYLRVNVINIPSSSSSTTRSRSSCAHSSCACASHCACACACACAGGGRAGCSTKDFYNTGLKLSMFEKLNRKKEK